jgi:outer membrane protein insertion porin family/translocation and assembly module TamA
MRRASGSVLIIVVLGTFFTACREDGMIQVTGLSFQGVEQVDKGAIANALQTKKGSWIPWGRKRFFNRQAFEADLKRIDTFYRDRGFPDARVQSFDVKLNDAQDKVDITLVIYEGEPVRVAAIELNGFDVLTPADLQTLRETLPLQPEQPLDRQLAIASRDRAANLLREQGYPYAEVSLADEDVTPLRRTIVMDATPGILARFGPIDIRGEMSVDEGVIRQQLLFKTGDRFTRSRMRDSQRRLYGLELFEFVNVDSLEEPVAQPEEVAVRITVAEGKHQKVTTGIGYGTEEQARARIRWDHVNFLGNARHAGFEGKWSSLDRGVRVDFREPYFLTTGLSLNFDGQAWQASEPVYDSTQLGGRITLRHQLTQRTIWSAAFINEYQKTTIDPEALEDFTIRDELIALGLDPRGQSKGTLAAVAFDVARNTTANVLDARQGYVINGHLEQAGKWLSGTFNYWSASAEARYYLPIAGQFVVASRLRAGVISPSGDNEANVPFYKRYFLGGSSSIRGWGRFEVSPLSGFGFPLGGFSTLDGSSEVRFPVWGKLGGVAFVDYGNVWSGPWDLNVKDLRYAVGPGLRYVTPIGPIRFDVGYQLNPIDGLLVNGAPQNRPLRIHFSIGQAF